MIFILTFSYVLDLTNIPINFKEIDERILKGVDYIVNLPNKSISNLPSTIIKVNKKGEITKLR